MGISRRSFSYNRVMNPEEGGVKTPPPFFGLPAILDEPLSMCFQTSGPWSPGRKAAPLNTRSRDTPRIRARSGLSDPTVLCEPGIRSRKLPSDRFWNAAFSQPEPVYWSPVPRLPRWSPGLANIDLCARRTALGSRDSPPTYPRGLCGR